MDRSMEAWAEVAKNVAKSLETDYVLSQRSAWDIFDLLCENYKSK